jgi:hypothetical protein
VEAYVSLMLNVSHLWAGRRQSVKPGRRLHTDACRRVLLDAGVSANAEGGGRPACDCDAGLAPAPSSLFPLADKAKS